MIIEEVDKVTGAIRFKKDKESRDLEYALKEIESLKKSIRKLESRVKELEKKGEA